MKKLVTANETIAKTNTSLVKRIAAPEKQIKELGRTVQGMSLTRKQKRNQPKV